MDFNEFCVRTKKVKILSQKDNLRRYDKLYLFSPEYNGVKPIELYGLYFPNDEEIRNLCLNNPNRFMKSFIDKLNLRNFENDPFCETKEFVWSKNMGIYERKDIDTLVIMLGKAYESRTFKVADLLESDIRIKALNICPEINVIGHFEKVQLGYSGIGFAVKDFNK